MIQANKLENEIDKTSDISDHALLTTELVWSTFDKLQHEKVNEPSREEIKKISVQRKMPTHFLTSEMANKSIQKLIDMQIEKIENQAQIDNFYKQFLTIQCLGPPKKRHKPWWCEELQMRR